MKTNKACLRSQGFAPIAIILVVVAVLAVGGAAYFSGKNENKSFVPKQDGGADIGLEPISCDKFEGKIKLALPSFSFKKSTTDMQPIFPGQSNTYCELVATSQGTRIYDLGENMRTYFDSNHWIFKPQEQADGATGTSFGYQNGPTMVTIGIHWINDEELCPDRTQPIGMCNTDISKAINEIRIQLWR